MYLLARDITLLLSSLQLNSFIMLKLRFSGLIALNTEIVLQSGVIFVYHCDNSFVMSQLVY